MSLITINNNINFFDIVWEDGVPESINFNLIKILEFDRPTEAVVMTLVNDITRELVYYLVEDPDNPGNPFANIEDFYAYISILFGVTIVVGVPIYYQQLLRGLPTDIVGNEALNYGTGTDVNALVGNTQVLTLNGVDSHSNAGVIAQANQIMIVKGRFINSTKDQLNGASSIEGRFYYGIFGGKWALGWGDSSPTVGAVGTPDSDLHTFMIYDKRFWILPINTLITNESILDIIANVTPIISKAAAFIANANTYIGSVGSFYCNKEMHSYCLGMVTGNVITWQIQYHFQSGAGVKLVNSLVGSTDGVLLGGIEDELWANTSDDAAAYLPIYGYTKFESDTIPGEFLYRMYYVDGNPTSQLEVGYSIITEVAPNAGFSGSGNTLTEADDAAIFAVTKAYPAIDIFYGATSADRLPVTHTQLIGVDLTGIPEDQFTMTIINGIITNISFLVQ